MQTNKGLSIDYSKYKHLVRAGLTIKEEKKTKKVRTTTNKRERGFFQIRSKWAILDMLRAFLSAMILRDCKFFELIKPVDEAGRGFKESAFMNKKCAWYK